MKIKTDWPWIIEICNLHFGQRFPFNCYPVALRLELEAERKRNWEKYSGVPK